jgi:hypothetical protein
MLIDMIIRADNTFGTIQLYICLWLYSPLLDLGRLYSFLILYTVGRAPRMGDQHVARPLPTHRTTQIQNKRKQTSMPWGGFEPAIPAFERAKTVHALDRVATVIGFGTIRTLVHKFGAKKPKQDQTSILVMCKLVIPKIEPWLQRYNGQHVVPVCVSLYLKVW